MPLSEQSRQIIISWRQVDPLDPLPLQTAAADHRGGSSAGCGVGGGNTARENTTALAKYK